MRKGDRGGEVIGLNPNIRVYRYTKGQFFDAHCKCDLSLAGTWGSPLARPPQDNHRSPSTVPAQPPNHIVHGVAPVPINLFATSDRRRCTVQAVVSPEAWHLLAHPHACPPFQMTTRLQTPSSR